MKPNYYGNPYKLKIKSGSMLYLGPSIFLPTLSQQWASSLLTPQYKLHILHSVPRPVFSTFFTASFLSFMPFQVSHVLTANNHTISLLSNTMSVNSSQNLIIIQKTICR